MTRDEAVVDRLVRWQHANSSMEDAASLVIELELDLADLRADLACAKAVLAAAHIELALLSPVVREPVLKEAK